MINLVRQLNDIVKNIKGVCFDIKANNVTIYGKNCGSFLFLFLRQNSNLKFTQLMDLFCVDYPSSIYRFEINYVLLSMFTNYRILVKFRVNALSSDLISLCRIFKSSTGLEREVGDMYGVIFKYSNDLRRILTDYGFLGFPLRKEYPLSGYFEIRYDDGYKQIKHENIELSQELRQFKFETAGKSNEYL